MIDQRKFIRLIIGAIAGILVICLAVYFFTHKFLTLSLDNPDQISNLSYRVTDKDNKGITHLFGLYSVGRDQPFIKVSLTGNEETIIPISSLPLVSSKVPVTVHKLKQADIYSSKSLGCNTYDQSRDAVITYRCATAADALYELDSSTASPWQNKKIQDLALGLNYQNYLDGVMALTASDATERAALIYTAAGLRYYKLNDAASRHVSVDLATDTTDRTNTAFVVFSPQSGDVAYYSVDAHDAATAKEYRYPHPGTDTSVRSRCVMAAATVYCLRGNFASPSGHNDDPFVTPEITQIDFSSSEPAVTTYSLKTNLQYVNDIFTDKQKRVFVKNDKDLYMVASKSLHLVYPGIVTAASGQRLTFTTDTSIYQMAPSGQSYKVFTGSDVQTSNLSSYGDTLLFDTFSKNDSLLTNGLTLKLSDSPLDNGPSTLGLLPLSASALPITSATLAHNKLQIQPSTFYTSDRETGQFTYDQQEYAKSMLRIQNHLADLRQQNKLPAALQILYAQ